MVYSIEELKQKIIPLAVKYNLPAVYPFGSYARNEATENSDVEIFKTDRDFYNSVSMCIMQIGELSIRG